MRGVKLPMKLMFIELTRLVDDFYNCDNLLIKKQILKDINLLNEALVLCEYPLNLRCIRSHTPLQQPPYDHEQQEEECIAGQCSLYIC